MSATLDNNIIFVGGIHGVGKTTLCKKISKELSLKHYSSSELIAKLKFENITDDKKVSNVLENQSVLLNSIKKYVDSESYCILDGHFCLLNSKEEVTEIPIDTFRSLGLKSIIVLMDEETEILNRLAERDKKQYQINLLKEFQEKEIYYAQKVAGYIGVKCKIFNVSTDINKLLVFINSIIDR